LLACFGSFCRPLRETIYPRAEDPEYDPLAARARGAVQAVDSEHVERRLAAIVSADVYGYSRLMAEDE
jgi:class 3 adenylate cyclase